MRPHLILGGPDKSRYDFGLNVAKENNYNFISLDPKEIFPQEKKFFTSSLDDIPTLFFINDVNKLSASECQRLINIIKDSDRKFILSASVYPNYILTNFCLLKKMDVVENELSTAIKLLAVENDRKIVRSFLKEIDPIYLFNILKMDAYRNPEVLDAMISINRNLYKVKKDYIISLIAYLIPQKMFSMYHKKPQVNPLEMSIRKKIKESYRGLTKPEIADVFLMMKSCKFFMDSTFKLKL